VSLRCKFLHRVKQRGGSLAQKEGLPPAIAEKCPVKSDILRDHVAMGHVFD
jgi:hypothetical protein